MTNSASECLKRNLPTIMERWEKRACQEVEAAVHQDSLALRNSLPEYLGQLVNALSTTIDRTRARVRWDRQESTRVGLKHGRERAGRANYTMDQLIFEYHILRQVIFEVMEEEVTLTPDEREVIICSVEQAVNDAATEFYMTLTDIQEKLTHTLAHDLRGPITSAKLSAQLILRRPENADHCVKIASRISNNMDRLDAMIHDLLDASRIRAGEGLALELEECDLVLIARQVADEFNFTHGNSRFQVVSKGQYLGWWNEDGLRRVIENLATNAVKYGDADAPITFRLDHDGDGYTLAVHNAGKPIPVEEQDILFQQYRRARTAEDKSGWGLGLTVVKGMAEAHHGTVHIESGEGKGTSFVVRLPRDSREPDVT